MRSWLTPQYGFFFQSRYEPNINSRFEIERLTNWLDWRVEFFGWHITAWIERVESNPGGV